MVGLTHETPESANWLDEPVGGVFDAADWNDRLSDLYAYWRSIRPADGVLPGRQHFDPIAIPRLLPSIWILDIQREPFRLKYRLVGTNIVTVHHADFTGRWYDEARPALLKVSPDYTRYRRMAEEGRATWRRGKPVLAVDPHWHTTENVMMPLATDGRNVDKLLCASIYYGFDGRMI